MTTIDKIMSKKSADEIINMFKKMDTASLIQIASSDYMNPHIKKIADLEFTRRLKINKKKKEEKK